jgi:hypothetical protein
MPAFVIFFVIFAGPWLLYSFVLFDRLVREEYREHRQLWDADGRPRGFFWRAPECSDFGSSMAMNRLNLVWLFRTPAWIEHSAPYKAWLNQMRVCVAVWNINIVFFLAVFLFSL